MKVNQLTHTDKSGNPQMVDVSGKAITKRTARARAEVEVGAAILKLLTHQELITKKGPVFQTAILAGTMAAKKTAELIPLAHPIGIEECTLRISTTKDTVIIDGTVSVASKTGVEMEALTAVSVAALTVYDMCKALSHTIIIREIKLMEKTGGKKDYKRNP
jgi:cyclic pyranopterin phosphate synthase